MIAPDLLAAMDAVSGLKHRARILHLIGDSLCSKEDDDVGNALAVIADDMRRDLEKLAEHLDALEAKG